MVFLPHVVRAEYEEVNLPDSAFDIISLAATWQF